MAKGIKGFQKGYTPWNKGKKYHAKPLSEGHKIKLSKIKKKQGIKPPSRLGAKHTKETKKKMRKSASKPKPWQIGRIPWNKGKKLPQFSGKNHWNWKGGKVKHPNKRIRPYSLSPSIKLS